MEGEKRLQKGIPEINIKKFKKVANNIKELNGRHMIHFDSNVKINMDKNEIKRYVKIMITKAEEYINSS